MEVIRHATAGAMLAEAGEFLVAHEAEHNLQLGILLTIRDRPDAIPEPPYLATVRDATGIVLAAVRTPPRGVLLSEPGAEGDRLVAGGAALVRDLVAIDPAMYSAMGPAATLDAFVAPWCTAAGRVATTQMRERVYRLSRSIPPAGVPGRARLAGEGDVTMLRAWLLAFQDEALPPGSPEPAPDELIRRWVRRDDRFAYLWEVDGRAVSLAVAGSRTPNGRRIGPVYTPPVDRGHGYASAVTAAASVDQLARGSRFCFLFTDLANPTSNAIYQRIGYEAVSDVAQVRFDPAGV